MARIALVTGTSSGIGLASAVALARAGFHVIATMRDPARAGPLRERAAKDGVALDVRALDVEQDASVSACVAGVLRDCGRVDLLVNNAGAGYLGTLEQTTDRDLRRTFEVNFFGVWRTTRGLFPAMRAARSGRIVSVTSTGGLIGQPFNDAYCAAKFAVEGMMESLAPVALRFGVHVSLIEPGPVNTEFVGSVQKTSPAAAPREDDPYAALIAAYRAGSQAMFASLGQTGDDVASVIVEAATAEVPHLRYLTSDFVRQIAGRKYVDLTGDSIVAATAARLG